MRNGEWGRQPDLQEIEKRHIIGQERRLSKGITWRWKTFRSSIGAGQ